MAAPDVAPPCYIDPPAFVSGGGSGELPEYSRNAAADERIVLAQPSAPRPSTRVPTDYVFTSDRLELNMGPKRFPVKIPCYGWSSVVEGTVLVKDFKAVAKITVTLEGVVNTNVMERRMAVYNCTRTLLLKSQVIWTRPEGSTPPSDTSSPLPFSIPIPSYVQGTSIRLPHSYATTHPGLGADVTYELRVDVFKKGLRRHERLKTMVLYLPRSTPPEPTERPLSIVGEPQDLVEWETIPITPKYSQTPEKSKRASQLSRVTSLSRNPLDLVTLVLPLPKAYASAAPIPFHISFPANSPLLPNIANSLSIHLIKVAIIRAGGFISMREGIIGTGEIWRIEDELSSTPPPSPTSETPSLNPRKVYRGTLKSFREGGETSWNIAEFLEIRYSIRVRIRSTGPGDNGSTLPEYYVDHPVQMCTHNRIPNAEDIHDPVIGLIAVAGSQGLSTVRPPSGGIINPRPVSSD